MGGNGPLVVMDDADLEAAAEATLTACYLCAGQSCTAGERILVHRAVHDEFVELLARRVTERILLGDPFDDATTMGPLNNEPVAQKMDEHVGDAVERGADRGQRGRARERVPDRPLLAADGARRRARRCAGRRRGDVRPDRAGGGDRLARARDRADQRLAVRAAGGDLHRRSERGAASSPTGSGPGWVNINESSNYWEAHLPFGGRAGTDSGIGRVGGAHVMHSFTELQTVVLTPHGRRCGVRRTGRGSPARM